MASPPTTSTGTSSGANGGPASPLPLEAGDRLTRAEFERRYDAMPELKKAELIEGVVHIMPSPVRWDRHAAPHFDLVTWLGTYRGGSPGVKGGDNGSLRLDTENEPQPDAALLIDPACGGRVTFSPDDYVVGGPELVAEVASSSASIDLGAKQRVYLRNGVQEYVVWRVLERAVDWFVLRGGRFEAMALSPAGFYQSGVFPGLWLDPAALVREDMPQVLRVVQQGLASAEHAAFVVRLRQQSGGQP